MSPLDTVFGAIMVGLCVAAAIVLFVVGARETRRNNRARRAAAMAAHPAGREFERSAYQQPRTDLCHVEGCGQPYAHVIHGWRLCTDCRDEIEARADVEVFDQEAAQLVDETEAFLRANGGAA